MLTVVKIGGGVIDRPKELDRFLADFAAMPGDKILVHGGGRVATQLSTKLGIATTMIDGRRVTDRDTLDVVTMVYAGLINKNIVAQLQSHGCNAIGLTGADGNAIRATRRPSTPIDYGFVGDISTEGVNTRLISVLLSEGKVPVFCAITHDGAGALLNCNADSVAGAVAIAMAQQMPTRLVYCFEQTGVMADIDDPDSLIRHITPAEYLKYKAEGVISGGMIPKIDNALAAIDRGVQSVVIKNAANLSNDIETVISR